MAVEGMAAFRAAIASLKVESLQVMEAALDQGADEMVALAQGACPVNDLDPHPGDLKKSVRKTAPRELQRVVVADAVDANGKWYGAHVELGHHTKAGGSVPPQPFFYPAWRLTKKKTMARIRAGIRKAAKGEAASGA